MDGLRQKQGRALVQRAGKDGTQAPYSRGVSSCCTLEWLLQVESRHASYNTIQSLVSNIDGSMLARISTSG